MKIRFLLNIISYCITIIGLSSITDDLVKWNEIYQENLVFHYRSIINWLFNFKLTGAQSFIMDYAIIGLASFLLFYSTVVIGPAQYNYSRKSDAKFLIIIFVLLLFLWPLSIPVTAYYLYTNYTILNSTKRNTNYTPEEMEKFLIGYYGGGQKSEPYVPTPEFPRLIDLQMHEWAKISENSYHKMWYIADRSMLLKHLSRYLVQLVAIVILYLTLLAVFSDFF